MGCRVGITTNEEERKKHWKSQYPSMKNWKILKTFNNKTDAQKYETAKAKSHKCVAHHGGDGPEKATWIVYHFDFNETKASEVLKKITSQVRSK